MTWKLHVLLCAGLAGCAPRLPVGDAVRVDSAVSVVILPETPAGGN